MKKILFCAAVVALATACTEDEFGGSQISSQAQQGLYFDASLADGATTRGELYKDENGTYPFFWYAEQDRINVFALNAKALTSTDGDYADNTSTGVATADGSGVWTLTNGAATYKATRSEGSGRFTAASPADMLGLQEYNAQNAAGTTATIVATYGINATGIASALDGQSQVVPGQLSALELTTTEGNATQAVDRMNQVVAPMWSVSSAIKENAYDAFGEKANLRLIRPFPVLRFALANAERFSEDFGKLKSVELTTLVPGANAAPATPGSDIAYQTSKKYTVIGEETGFESNWAETSDGNKVTVNLGGGAGAEWKDGDAVYMTVAPVERTKEEVLKIVYTFEKITFTLDGTKEDAKAFEKITTKNNWTSVDANGNPNAVTALPALDINNYDYLLTNTPNRTLIVNKGDFSSIFGEDGKIIWGDAANVELSDVASIIVADGVNMTEKDLQGIQNFANLTSVELNNVTSIPANTFKGLGSKLTKVILPKVTKIDEKFIDADFSVLAELNLASYEFENEAINERFFNDTEKSVLETLDISGVESMMPTFGINRALSFKGYTALETITVKDGIVVAPNGFAGCKLLKTINGKLDLAGAVSAFNMEGDANAVLKAVNIIGTDIPESAFNNCTALESILKDGAQVVPTSIGAKAFASASALKYMDLSKAETIGASAFEESGLTGPAKGANVLTVGVTAVEANVFKGTVVYMVEFTNATTIEPGIFSECNALRQVKFDKVFTAETQTSATAWDGTFADSSKKAENVDLFLATGQGYMSGTTMKLPYKVGQDAATYDITFKTVQYGK